MNKRRLMITLGTVFITSGFVLSLVPTAEQYACVLAGLVIGGEALALSALDRVFHVSERR